MNQKKSEKRGNNKGSALVLVLTVISFIAILGAISMSTALMNIKIRGLNRSSDKNFYRLEIALDEIYAQTGRRAAEILKEEYASILSGLYREGLDTNEKANEELQKRFIEQFQKEFKIKLSSEDSVKEENCKKAAEVLKEFATSFAAEEETEAKEKLRVSVREVEFKKSPSPSPGEPERYTGVTFKGMCLNYENTETDVESALTLDLRIDVPYVRFINNGSTLLDYILVANEEIGLGAGVGISGELGINGSMYGNWITVDSKDVEVSGSLVTAAGNLTVKQGGSLLMGPDPEAGGTSRVWADGIELRGNSALTAEDTAFFVQDDLTLQGNGNNVTLSGSYYGYGNEGNNADNVVKETRDKSSAILLNDKGSRLDLTGLHSLVLAGRAYLRFNTAGSDGTENFSQYIYPMGESLAVRATQSIYLVPEKYLSIQAEGENPLPAGSNPVPFPANQERIELKVDIPAGVLGESGRQEMFTITREMVEKGVSGGAGAADADNPDSAAFLIALKGKVYVYYNFLSDRERADYFESYLENEAASFEALLKKGRVTGGAAASDTGGIYIREEGMDGPEIFTSGVLYQVAGKNQEGNEDTPIFELLNIGQGKLSTSISWVEYEEELKESFLNLKTNLAETKRVSGRAGSGSGVVSDTLLPVGNYVKLKEINELTEPIAVPGESPRIVLISGNSHIFLEGDKASVRTEGGGTRGNTFHMDGGLIVAGGDITVGGTGMFDGLIVAGGKIIVDSEGDITLTANPSLYEAHLEDETVSPYFYDYGHAASTVLNRYEDFVTKENWSRTGLRQGGGT